VAERDRGNKVKVVGAALGLAGGVLVVLGAVTPWVRSKGISVGAAAIPPDIRGLDVSVGWLLLASGISAIAFALGAMLAKFRVVTVLGVGLIVGALVAGAIVVLNVSAAAGDAYVAFAVSRARDAGVVMDGVEASIRELVQHSSLNVERGIGLWLAAVGAALCLVAGALLAWTGFRSKSVPAHIRTEKQPESTSTAW
jgi:hypothetical protein